MTGQPKTLETEYISRQQFDSYSRRIERAYLKKNHHSLTASGIARYTIQYIVEIRDSGKTLLMKAGWREAMKAGAEAFRLQQENAKALGVKV